MELTFLQSCLIVYIIGIFVCLLISGDDDYTVTKKFIGVSIFWPIVVVSFCVKKTIETIKDI